MFGTRETYGPLNVEVLVVVVEALVVVVVDALVVVDDVLVLVLEVVLDVVLRVLLLLWPSLAHEEPGPENFGMQVFGSQ